MVRANDIGGPLIPTGWVALSLGTAVPLIFGLWATWQLRGGQCTTDVFYRFAPMLIVCGVPSEAETIAGWILTVVSVSSHVLATLASLWMIVRLVRAPRGSGRRTPAVALIVTTLAVIMAVATVLSAQPDQIWGTNSWIFLSALASAGVLLAAAVIVPIILSTQRRIR